MLVDNSKYHHARLHKEWRKKSDRVFHLEYLSPYSPNLNPIERVWKLKRRTSVHNRDSAIFNDVIESVECQFHVWLKPNSTQKSLCVL